MFTWLAAQFAKLTGSVIKEGLGVANDAIDVPKKLTELKQTRLEIKKLEHERDERESLITPATFDDVRQYDPKHQRLVQRISSPSQSKRAIISMALLICVGGAFASLYVYRNTGMRIGAPSPQHHTHPPTSPAPSIDIFGIGERGTPLKLSVTTTDPDIAIISIELKLVTKWHDADISVSCELIETNNCPLEAEMAEDLFHGLPSGSGVPLQVRVTYLNKDTVRFQEGTVTAFNGRLINSTSKQREFAIRGKLN